MLRQPGSRYEPGRSPTALGGKRFRDATAEAIEHQPGAGRHNGRFGAFAGGAAEWYDLLGWYRLDRRPAQ